MLERFVSRWTISTRTNGRDGLHELVLLQLEEDGGFSSSIQPKSHHADLHLWTDVDSVVLQIISTRQSQAGTS